MLANFNHSFGLHPEMQEVGYVSGLMALLPYCFVILAVAFSLQTTVEPQTTEKPSDPELYIVVLMLVFSGIHLYGQQQQLFYHIDSMFQASLVGLWLLMGSAILLRLSSKRKAIVRASNNAILTTSTDGKILSANPAAVQMFQSLEQDLKGRCVSGLFFEKDQMYLFFITKVMFFRYSAKIWVFRWSVYR
ncbi:MAG: PAS domain-containing protein [Alteromonadaceae bacterium]|jgi:PAS domain-containing protein